MKDRILKMMQKEDVCIIMDFDYTITDYSSYSSIGVFKNYLGKKYCIRKEKIDNAISQLEKNNDELLEMLWRKKIDLLHEFVNEDFLNKINVSDNFIIRNEIKIILKKADPGRHRPPPQRNSSCSRHSPAGFWRWPGHPAASRR